ncbi:hypothetical protein BOX15_Mlig023563g6, partial [Macrostomum lignano]
ETVPSASMLYRPSTSSIGGANANASSADEATPLLISGQSGGADAIRRQRLLARRRSRAASLTILLVELLERLAFYGATANLVLTLGQWPFLWVSYVAASASLFMSGLAYGLSLFFGWLSDTWLGAFNTCALGFLIYLIGLCGLPVLLLLERYGHTSALCGHLNSGIVNASIVRTASFPSKLIQDENSTAGGNMFEQNCSPIVIASLCCLAIGSGALKANLSPLGAQQIKDPVEQSRFFNWFYWACNVGSFAAYFFLTYTQQNLGKDGRLAGYLVPPVAMTIASLAFVACRPMFRLRKPAGSLLTRVVRLLAAAVSASFRLRRQRKRRLLADGESDSNNSGSGSGDSAPMRLHAAAYDDWLDCARHGGRFTEGEVHDVRALLRVVLIFVSIIPYWLLYFQMQSTYLVQGLHLRLQLDGSIANIFRARYRTIPPAWLSLCDIVVIIALIPLLTKLVFPWLERRGKHPSLATQILLGMSIALASVLCAGVLESYRLSVLWGNSTNLWPVDYVQQQIGNMNYTAANVSIMWQVPQYCLMGTAEAFMSVACLRLAFQGAPRNMKGLITGLFWFTCGCGSFVGVALVSGLAGAGVWFQPSEQGNPNCRLACSTDPTRICAECHMDFYFYLLSGIQLGGLLLFALLRSRYRLATSVDDFTAGSAAVGDAVSQINNNGPRLPGYSANRRNVDF